MSVHFSLARRLVSGAVMVLCTVVGGSNGVRAAEPQPQLHGVVLGVTPRDGMVVVRNDAFARMPAMTMTFRILPQSRARELSPGAVIDADVDLTTEPPTLRHVVSSAAQAVTVGSAVRTVAPLRVGDFVPGTRFVDQRGRPFSFGSLRGDDVVLAFIYTRCQDARMCPLISAKFHALQAALSPRAAHLVEMTLDPTYDRPPVLARYGETFGADPARWTLAVGDAGATLDFAARFGVSTFPDPQIGIVHSENTVIVDRDGRIAEMIPDSSWTTEEIIAQIEAQRGRSGNFVASFFDRIAAAASRAEADGPDRLRDAVIGLVIAAALAYLGRRVYRAIFAQHV